MKAGREWAVRKSGDRRRHERLVGGQLWIPNNQHQRALEKPDSREDALTYLMALSHGMIDPVLAATYVDTGRR